MNELPTKDKKIPITSKIPNTLTLSTFLVLFFLELGIIFAMLKFFF